MTQDRAETLGQVIQSCPKDFASIKISEVYKLKDVRPGAYRLVLLACAKEQLAVLRNLWATRVFIDLPVELALKSFVRYGEIGKFMNVESPEAKTLLKIAAAAASEALLYK